MIVLDTNVVSAFMRREIEPRVGGWLDSQNRSDVFTTSVTIYELRYGIDILPMGRRRQTLELAFATALEVAFAGRILPFDAAAAQAAGSIAASLRKQGRSFEIRDCQIAGIAMVRGALLATRNLDHFEGAGLALFDPWSGTAGLDAV